MFQKFNNNTIITKFIKDLLKDTYIPTVSIWNPGDALIAGFTYITKEYIVKAKLDYPNENDKNIKLTDVFNSDYFEIIEPYVEGKFYNGVTSNYESCSAIYDSNTHLQLGNYLRMLRDLKHINLMQYYNCCNGIISDKLRIEYINNNREIINTNNTKDGFKTILVPIKYYKEYTIYLNSNYPVTITPIYYDGTNVLKQSRQLAKDMQIVNNISFNNPYLYHSPKPKGENIVLSEKYLTLLIQVPEKYSSNVLVLEGDFSENRFINRTDEKGNIININDVKKVHFGESLIELQEKESEKYFISIPSLTRNLNQNMVAFSDRLIEYLLLNVIDKNEEITQNIRRVQTYISSYKSQKVNNTRYNKSYIKGVWDRNIREFVYNLAINNKNSKRIDINGYIDKDTESIILGGKE